MPPEPGLALDQRDHGLHPSRVLEAFQTARERLPDVGESITALHGVTAGAYGAAHRLQLDACNTLPGRQVVRGPGHLGGLRQPAGNLSSFLLKHLTLSWHNKVRHTDAS